MSFANEKANHAIECHAIALLPRSFKQVQQA